MGTCVNVVVCVIKYFIHGQRLAVELTKYANITNILIGLLTWLFERKKTES